jgi:hypothetical protein
MAEPIYLDRVAIGDVEVAPLSATLHTPDVEHRACDLGMAEGGWWVVMFSGRLPERVNDRLGRVGFKAWTASGRELVGTVMVANRTDDDYGTRLELIGVRSMAPDLG